MTYRPPIHDMADVANIACNALDTLVALMKHQRICRQCEIDETYCETAHAYQTNFMSEVRHYERAKVGLP